MASIGADTEHLRLQGMREWLGEGATIFVGYVCAVTAATLAFSASGVPILLAQRWVPNALLDASGVNGIPIRLAQQWASRAPLSDRPSDIMILLVIVGAIFWFFTFISALLPFTAALTMARRLKIRSVFYHIACGTMTGLVLTPVALFIGDFLVGSEHAGSFLQDWGHAAPKFMFYGACGAVAFWSIAGRHIGHTHAEALSQQN